MSVVKPESRLERREGWAMFRKRDLYYLIHEAPNASLNRAWQEVLPITLSHPGSLGLGRFAS